MCTSAVDPAAATSGAGESSDLPPFLLHFQPLFPPGGQHGGPCKLLVDSKPLVSQDFIRSRPELSQTSDPSKTTGTEPPGSAARSRCCCVCLVRRTARLATFGTPCTRGAFCLVLLSPEATGHPSTLARLLVCELQSLGSPCIKHVRLRTKRLRCEAHPATPLETLQPSLASLR